MGVTKINGFAAPYRSQTFQNLANAMVGRNGVVTMAGKVTQAGATITVPPFTFVQNGLLVTKDVATALEDLEPGDRVTVALRERPRRMLRLIEMHAPHLLVQLHENRHLLGCCNDLHGIARAA